MVNAIHTSDALGRHAGQNQSRRGAKIARHDIRAAERLAALDDGAWPLDRDVRAHPCQLVHVHEARLKNPLGDDADPGRLEHEHHHLCLHIGRETGVRHGGDIHRAQLFGGADAKGVAPGLDSHAGLAHFVEHRAEVAGVAIAQRHVTVRHRTGEGVGCRLDPVGDHPVLRPPEPSHALDSDRRAAGAGDFCAHGVEELGQVLDLRLAGGAVNECFALGQARGHQHVGRAENRGAATAAEEALAAGQPLGLGVHVTGLDADFCAKVAHALEVQIDRARADDTASGHRHLGLVEAAHERPENTDRATHFADQVVVAEAGDFPCPNTDRSSVHLN